MSLSRRSCPREDSVRSNSLAGTPCCSCSCVGVAIGLACVRASHETPGCYYLTGSIPRDIENLPPCNWHTPVDTWRTDEAAPELDLELSNWWSCTKPGARFTSQFFVARSACPPVPTAATVPNHVPTAAVRVSWLVGSVVLCFR